MTSPTSPVSTDRISLVDQYTVRRDRSDDDLQPWTARHTRYPTIIEFGTDPIMALSALVNTLTNHWPDNDGWQPSRARQVWMWGLAAFQVVYDPEEHTIPRDWPPTPPWELADHWRRYPQDLALRESIREISTIPIDTLRSFLVAAEREAQGRAICVEPRREDSPGYRLEYAASEIWRTGQYILEHFGVPPWACGEFPWEIGEYKWAEEN